MFIVGSLIFLGVAVAGAWLRHSNRGKLSVEEQIFEVQAFRP